jgi:phosphatidylserine decarboxylase
MPKIFPRRQVSTPSTENKPSVTINLPDDESALTPSTPTPTLFSPPRAASASPEPTGGKKRPFKKKRSNKRSDYNFSAANDIVGIVMLEIKGATDLPRLKNSALFFIWPD